jgi:hypothetical protein
MTLIDERLAPVIQPETVLQPETGPELAFWFDPKGKYAPAVAIALRDALHAAPAGTELTLREAVSELTTDMVDAAITAHKAPIAAEVGELIEQNPRLADKPMSRVSLTKTPRPTDRRLESTADMMPPIREIAAATEDQAIKEVLGEITVSEPETTIQFRHRLRVEALHAEILRPCTVPEATVIMEGLFREAIDRSEPEPVRRQAARLLLAIEFAQHDPTHILHPVLD